jgi:hypothetical protein
MTSHAVLLVDFFTISNSAATTRQPFAIGPNGDAMDFFRLEAFT